VKGEKYFLANYSDGLSDLPLDKHIADAQAKNVAASFISVRSWQSFHAVQADAEGYVKSIGPVRRDDQLINGGYFVLRADLFDHMQEGEEMVEKPFQRLAEKRLLATYPYLGFWQAMDTFKDKITFDRMEAQGNCPWMVWRTPSAAKR
jgi:glucose-1-phosphate cytidylyltransferase